MASKWSILSPDPFLDLPRIVNLKPREAKPFTRLREFELRECSESVIVVRRTAEPMTFLRAIPCSGVSPRRSFSAEMGALAKEDVSGRSFNEG